MRNHGTRNGCYVAGEGFLYEPDYLAGGSGCPMAAGGSTNAAKYSSFRFGRMFPAARRLPGPEAVELYHGLLELGSLLNQPTTITESDVPAGYTYLGQFIAHEITFDAMQELPANEPNPQNLRSPSIDLDSIYGTEPRDEDTRRFYDENDPALLKTDWTADLKGIGAFQNDLPRDPQTFSALIGDPRNDENLAVAQTHVAFIKFHNKVVERLREEHHAEGEVFECARMQVVKHFQWLILKDYLPRLIDKSVLACVLDHGARWFRVTNPRDLYMPLEFSAAAFRFGHSMVRGDYQWNRYHAKGEHGAPIGTILGDLFDQTGFKGGNLGINQHNLPTDWIIDWRRFYEFPTKPVTKAQSNLAARIDTSFDFHLDQLHGFPPADLPEKMKSITVRNLLRGFALQLPTGEEAAAHMGEPVIPAREMAAGPQEQLLSSPTFRRKTPLWYYILKEAQINKGRLGPVGSRLVAETLVGLIRNSRYSILKDRQWEPRYTERTHDGKRLFEMTDLLEFAKVVNPLPD